MPFTVVWLPTAQDALADIWVHSADRQAVADAANRIDRALRLKPESLGRPQQGYRVYADPPLIVAYQVLPDDRLVRVVQVSHR
jgi:plasmid stabilization system protein ParE